MSKKIPPVIGTKYGCYTVISDEIGIIGQRGYYLVKCSCEKEQYIRIDILKSGQATKCRYCSNKINYDRNCELGKIQRKGYTTGYHQGTGDLTKTHLYRIKVGAQIRDKDWSEEMTTENLWNLFLLQNGKCALSGLDISLRPDNKNIPINSLKHNLDYSIFTASLDRIDSNIGYILSNVQWVHRNINIMKNCYDQNYFIYLCTQISNYANQQPSIVKEHNSSNKGSETTEMNSSNNNSLQENPTSNKIDDDIVRTI